MSFDEIIASRDEGRTAGSWRPRFFEENGTSEMVEEDGGRPLAAALAALSAKLREGDFDANSTAAFTEEFSRESAHVVDIACVLRWFCLQRLISPTVGLIELYDGSDWAGDSDPLWALSDALRAAEISGELDQPPGEMADGLFSLNLPDFGHVALERERYLWNKLIAVSRRLASAAFDNAALAEQLEEAMKEEARLALRYGRLTWSERRTVRAAARG